MAVFAVIFALEYNVFRVTEDRHVEVRGSSEVSATLLAKVHVVAGF